MSDGLSQIVMNLVINARDAMPEGGTVTIRAEKKDGEMLHLSVGDTGTGIDPDIVSRIFDPFFTTKEQGKGTGLGLSFVYNLVQDMKGTVEVDSVPGAGTVIHIFLPLHPKGPVRQVVEQDGVIRFEGYTVLVAEDEPELLAIISDYLKNLGMKVISAENGADALVKQDEFEGDIDFLLTDIVMPELNGIKLAELLQSLRTETKVVFMSGFPEAGNAPPLKIPEGAVLLAKPLVFEKLATVLKSVLDRDHRDNNGEHVQPVWQSVEA